MTNNDILEIIFVVKKNIKYEVDKDGIVTIYEKQDHWAQNLFRKLKFKIPVYKKISLDEYGSYIFLNIDGNKTVKELGKCLECEFGKETQPLYERLLLFLNHIEVNCEYIEKIS